MSLSKVTGNLRKLRTQLDQPVSYRLPVGEQELPLNERIGQTLRLRYSGAIHCVHCGRSTKKSFNQGYCYPCMTKLAQCDSCIVKPELCHFDQGTCREPSWGEQHCLTDHIVYLANSSGLKVGITRHSQLPTRWIDQGAVQALPIFRVATRQISGLVEVAFKAHVADKTSWQKMLKGVAPALDLQAERDRLLMQVAPAIEALQARFGLQAVAPIVDADALVIDYPVENYPTKVVSFNLDKQAEVEGTLLGIKGQYLIFDTGVINIRKYSGYQVDVA